MADDVTPTIAQILRTLANNLERHMQDQEMSEGALARACGISPRTVGNFLRPDNRHSMRGTSKSFPSGTLANLVKIAMALDVEAWQLMCNMDTDRARFLAAVEQAYTERRQRESGKLR